MSGFYMRNYISGDALKMVLRTSHIDRPECAEREGLHNFLEDLNKRGVRIFVIESKAYGIMAIVPVYFLWTGVAEITLYSSPLGERFVRAALRTGFMLLSYIEDRFKLHRIQATVKAGDRQALKFNQKIGFQVEGCLKKYNPWGDDYLLVARVSEVK